MAYGGYSGGDGGNRRKHRNRERREDRRDRGGKGDGRQGQGRRDSFEGHPPPGPPPGPPPPTAVPYSGRMDLPAYSQEATDPTRARSAGGGGSGGSGGVERAGAVSQEPYAGSDLVKSLSLYLEQQDVCNIAKVLQKLAKNDVKVRNDPQLRDFLVGLTQLLKGKMEPPCCPKDIADLAFALGKLQVTDDCCKDLLKHIAEIAKVRVEQFTPHDMSSMVWGFASLGVRNENLMSVIAAEVVNKIAGFDQRQLANTAWAFAKCGLWNDQLVSSIADECYEKIHTFTAQSLSHISWAMAQWGTRKDDLMDSVAVETQRKISEFAPSSLAMTAWSFASLQLKCVPLMQAISREAIGKLTHFKTQDLAHLGWAFANVRMQDADLFSAMAVDIQKNIKGTLPPELSNIAWAFSKNNFAIESLMESIAQEAVLQIRQFKAAEIAMLTWAFAVAGMQNKTLMTEIGHQVAKKVDKFAPPQLSHIAWAFGALSLRHSEFLTALSQHLRAHVDAFKGQSLANIAWSFAMVTFPDVQLLLRIAPAIASEASELRPLALARCAWAYFILQVQSPELMQALAKESLKKVADFPTKALLKLVDSIYCCANVKEVKDLEAAVADRIKDIAMFFIKAHGTPESPLRPAVHEYSEGLRDIAIHDAGIFGTPLLLKELGIDMPSLAWVQTCRRPPFLLESPDLHPRRPTKGGPSAITNHYAAAEVEVSITQEVFKKWFVRYANEKDRQPPPRGASADHEIGLFIPDLNGGKGVASDLTGLVLAEIYDEICNYGCSPTSTESCATVTGSVRMVASSVPCLPVIGGLRQFLVTFPNVTLEFYEQAGTLDD